MFKEFVPLKNFTSFKIGGVARYFFETSSVDELTGTLSEATKYQMQFLILGGGTNLLISDKGFDGIVFHLADGECEFKENGEVIVPAGHLMSGVVRESAERGLAGLEWAGGLPGTVGGAIRGNAGCFGGEIKNTTQEVKSLRFDPAGSEWKIIKRNNAECKFAYRSSIFKILEKKELENAKASPQLHSLEIIIETSLELHPGSSKEKLLSEVEDKISYRKERHPLEYPNAGSVFKNLAVDKLPSDIVEHFKTSVKTDPFPVVPAAKVIFEAGLKGKRIGDAEVSIKHPNFIVNLGSASFENVRELIFFEKEEVKKRFGIELEEEIQIIS